MTRWELAAVFLLTWAGTALLIDAWLKRDRRPDLAERLAPFRRSEVADEAEQWLRTQHRHS